MPENQKVLNSIDYAKELTICTESMKKGDYRGAGNRCGFIFEAYLKDIYVTAKKLAKGKHLHDLIEKEKEFGIAGREPNELTLHSLISLYQSGGLIFLAAKYMKKQLRAANYVNLCKIKKTRNTCIHDPKEPNREDVIFFFYFIKSLLEEIAFIESDYVSKQSIGFNLLTDVKKDSCFCPHCNKEVLREWAICPICANRIKFLCPQCNYEIEKDWNACPKCGTSIILISKTESEKLKHAMKRIEQAEKSKMPCPICKTTTFMPEPIFDDDDEGVFFINVHTCDCYNKIKDALECGSLYEVLKGKYLDFDVTTQPKPLPPPLNSKL
jgi:hypothetical protein